jgi:hypothetical protein
MNQKKFIITTWIIFIAGWLLYIFEDYTLDRFDFYSHSLNSIREELFLLVFIIAYQISFIRLIRRNNIQINTFPESFAFLIVWIILGWIMLLIAINIGMLTGVISSNIFT